MSALRDELYFAVRVATSHKANELYPSMTLPIEHRRLRNKQQQHCRYITKISFFLRAQCEEKSTNMMELHNAGAKEK